MKLVGEAVDDAFGVRLIVLDPVRLDRCRGRVVDGDIFSSEIVAGKKMQVPRFEQMLVKRGRGEPMTEALVRVDDHIGRNVEFFDNSAPRILGGGAENEKIRRASVRENEAHIDRVTFASGRENERDALRKRGVVKQNDLLDLNTV